MGDRLAGRVAIVTGSGNESGDNRYSRYKCSRRRGGGKSFWVKAEFLIGESVPSCGHIDLDSFPHYVATQTLI